MTAAAAPTEAPAMVPDEAERAMITWSRELNGCDMMGEIEVEDDVDLQNIEMTRAVPSERISVSVDGGLIGLDG